MRGMHFSLRWMFGFVSFLAIGCGLLVYANPILSRLTLTVCFITLLAAVLAAAGQTGERRMFWAGFAAFGLAYGWIVCGTWQSPDGSALLRDRLATTVLLQWCHEKAPHTRSSTATVQSPGPGMMMMMGGMGGGPMPGSTGGPMGGGMMRGGSAGPGTSGAPPTTMVVSQAPNWDDFATTGHSLFALAFAMLGGVIAARCYRREGARGN